jgi:hypothetical protein
MGVNFSKLDDNNININPIVMCESLVPVSWILARSQNCCTLLQDLALQPVAMETKRSTSLTTVPTSTEVPVQATTPVPYFVPRGSLIEQYQVLVAAKRPTQTPTTPEVVYQKGHDGSRLQQGPVQLNYRFVNNTIGKQTLLAHAKIH